jgi:hypothetical protein
VKVGGARGAVRRGGTQQQEENLCLPTDADYTEHNETKDIFAMLSKSGDITPQHSTVFARCPKNFPVADMVTNSGQLLNITIKIVRGWPRFWTRLVFVKGRKENWISISVFL